MLYLSNAHYIKSLYAFYLTKYKFSYTRGRCLWPLSINGFAPGPPGAL